MGPYVSLGCRSKVRAGLTLWEASLEVLLSLRTEQSREGVQEAKESPPPSTPEAFSPPDISANSSQSLPVGLSSVWCGGGRVSRQGPLKGIFRVRLALERLRLHFGVGA